MKKFTLTLLFAFLFFSGVRGVSAHATPVSYEPEASSLLQTAPERVRIHFSENIEPNASGITVLAPDGSTVDMGKPAIDSSDRRMYQIAIKDGGQGTYTVSWQVVSADDGHFTKGAFAFSVGKQTAASNAAGGQIQIQHVTSIPQAMTIWIELLGQAFLLGALLMIAGVWKPLRRRFGSELSEQDMASVRRRITAVMVIGFLFIAAGIIALLVLKTLDLEALRSTDFVTTLQVFIGTPDGMHALIRGGLAAVFLVLFFIIRASIFREGRIGAGEAALFFLIFLMALSRARVSHSAATPFHPNFSIFITSLHLLSKASWVGSLFAFSLVFIPVLGRMKKAAVSFFSYTLFSKIISLSFIGTGVTGAYIVWIDLKSPVYIFSTEWGAWFIILSLAGGILFGLRAYHQLIIDTVGVDSLYGKTRTWAGPLLTISNYTRSLEMVVGIALLFVTSFIIVTTPPFPPEHFTFQKQTVSSDVQLTLQVHPFEPGSFLITSTDAKTHAPVPLRRLIVQLTNEERGIGPLDVETQERYDGAYVFPRSALSFPGVWRVEMIAQRPETFDAAASFTVAYPNDVESTRIDPEARSFGLFEAILLVSVLGIILLGLAFYYYSRRLNQHVADAGASANQSAIPESSTNGVKLYPLAILGTLILAAAMWFLYSSLLKTDFQQRCERDANFWLQSVPMRDGATLSSDTITGCTMNIGLYHFVDEREYAYFIRPRQSAVEIATVPNKPVAGQPTDFTLTISEIERGQKIGPVRDLGMYHDRILHLVVVGEDLSTFAHIHTEDIGPVTPEELKSGEFPLRYTFPKAGRYTLVVNYIVGGRELSQQSFIEVGGQPEMEKNAAAAAKLDRTLTKDIDGYHVSFDIPSSIKAGEIAKITYTIQKNGKDVTDLQPYLGAAMHLAVVRSDLGRVIHTHGQLYLPGSAFFQQLFQNYVSYHAHFIPDKFGPKVQARITFPQPGLYQIFGEFKHNNKVTVVTFAVEAQ